MPRAAVVQRPPVLLDRARTLSAAVASVAEAAAAGAKLIAAGPLRREIGILYP